MYKNKNLYLFYRPHYGFNKECLKKRDFNFDILYEIRTQAHKMNAYSKETKLVIGTLTSSVVDILLCLLNSYDNINTKYEKLNNVLNTFNSFTKDWKNPSIQFLNSCFSIITLVINYYGIGYDDNYEDDMDCSDDITNDNYNVMIHNLKETGTNIFIIWIVSIFLLVVNCLTIILGLIEAILKRKKDKDDSKKEILLDKISV